MDNLTHSLVGLMLARAGLEKTTARGTAMMVLAANAPDADAFVWFTGTMRYIEYHRTYTHSLTFLPLVALLPMLLARAKFSWRSYLAAIIGVLSHLLLDWTNAYGIPLALPFSTHRFRLDINNIVDVWILAILLIPVVATALSRLVSSEIGERKSTAPRRTWAWAALAALLVFEGSRVVTHARAVEVMSARLYEGAPPQRVTALPNGVNPFTWRGVIEGPSFAVIVPVDLRARIRSPRRTPVSRPRPSPRHGSRPAHPSLPSIQPLVPSALLASNPGRRRSAPGPDRPALRHPRQPGFRRRLRPSRPYGERPALGIRNLAQLNGGPKRRRSSPTR